MAAQGPRPYEAGKIPPQALLLLMMEQEKKKQAAQEQKNPAEGIFGPAAAGGGGVYAASQLGSGIASTAAENAAFNEAAGLASQASFNAGADAAGAGVNAAWNTGATEAGGGLGEGAATGGTWEAGAAVPTTLGALLALHGGYKSYKNFGHGDWKGGAKSGAETGAGIGTMILPGVGTAVGAGIGAIGGGLLGKIKAGKHKDQLGRDENRKMGVDKGVYDKDYNYTRLDGVTKNMGLDGSKGTYNIDFKDKSAVDLIPYLDPLSEVIAGGNAKRRSDQTGEFANALKDSKDPMAEIRNLYQKYGVGADQFKDYKTEDNRADVYRNSISKVLGSNPIPKSSPATSTPPPVPRPTPGNMSSLPIPITKGPLSLIPKRK